MSGSGGYYRYHCKNWMTYDCQNWVWMNNTPCANCVANGRDSEETVPVGCARVSVEVNVLSVEDREGQNLSTEEAAAVEAHSAPIGAPAF